MFVPVSYNYSGKYRGMFVELYNTVVKINGMKVKHQGPPLQKWFNFNNSMGKLLHPL